MPFCAYNYYCTLLLNARILRLIEIQNSDIILRNDGEINSMVSDIYRLPKQLANYFYSITAHDKIGGDKIHVNIPAIAILKNWSNDTVCGTFGRVTRLTHIVLEYQNRE